MWMAPTQSNWHHYIGDGTLAGAICDRILHNAYHLEIKGESMRKSQPDLDPC